MATICRSPPDSEPARWLRRSPSAGKISVTKSNRSSNFFGAWKQPICRFSAIVRLGKTLLVCGTKPMPLATRVSARWLVISSPRSVTVPVPTVTSPNNALSRVDLPAPLGPMMPTSSPSLAVEVGPVEDVDPGHVARDQVVGAQDRSVGSGEVRLAGLRGRGRLVSGLGASARSCGVVLVVVGSLEDVLVRGDLGLGPRRATASRRAR